MATRQSRGVVLRVDLGLGPVQVVGLRDVTANFGEVQFFDDTSHDTPQGSTSSFPTHIGEGEVSAPMNFDGQNATHLGLLARMQAMTLTNFQLTIPGSGTPLKRRAFAGYVRGLPEDYPVNGVVGATLTIRVNPPVTTEDDI